MKIHEPKTAPFISFLDLQSKEVLLQNHINESIEFRYSHGNKGYSLYFNTSKHGI